MNVKIRSIWFQEEEESSSFRPPGDSVEAAVVGGGVAGLAAAAALARAGTRTALLEKGLPGRGATGRSDGQVLLATGEHPSRLVGQLGEERAALLFRAMEENREIVARLPRGTTGWKASGGWRLAESPSEAGELEESAAWLASRGEKARFVPAEELGEALPSLARFHGALFRPGEGLVDPMGLASALGEEARKSGADLFPLAECLGLEEGPDGFRLAWRGPGGEEGRLSAQVVVLAASHAAAGLDPTGYAGRVLYPFRAQALATAPLDGRVLEGLPEAPMSSHFCYEYFRRHGRRLVAGGMRWSVPGEEVGLVDDGTIHPAVHENLLAWIARHIPGASEAPAELAWTGILCGTPDGLPACGMIPGKGGLFLLAGFNGYGLSLAPALAEALAEMVLEGRSSRPWAGLFRPSRF